MSNYDKHSYKPLFNRRRDMLFFNSINDELLNHIIQTPVIMYKVSTETESNIYGESTEKIYTEGIKIGALVTQDDQVTDSSEGFGPIIDQTLTVALHREMLESKSYYPEIGDIIEWNESYWEINGIVENQLLGGQIYKNYSIVVTANMVSRDKLNIENLRVGDNE